MWKAMFVLHSAEEEREGNRYFDLMRKSSLLLSTQITRDLLVGISRPVQHLTFSAYFITSTQEPPSLLYNLTRSRGNRLSAKNYTTPTYCVTAGRQMQPRPNPWPSATRTPADTFCHASSRHTAGCRSINQSTKQSPTYPCPARCTCNTPHPAPARGQASENHQRNRSVAIPTYCPLTLLLLLRAAAARRRSHGSYMKRGI